MAYNYVIIDGRKIDVVNRLRGAFVLELNARDYPTLAGTTLVFTTPAVTVTFTGTTVAQIKADIEAAHVSLRCDVQRVPTSVSATTQRLAIYSTGGSVAVDTTTSTSAALLGINVDGTVTVTGIPKANIVSFSQGATPDLYAVLVES